MAVEDLLITYKQDKNTNVAQETDANSLDPSTIADLGIDLADILIDELPKQNRFGITASNADPVGGNDTDLHYKAILNGIEIYRNIVGVWTLMGTIPLGLSYPNGILIGLRTSIQNNIVTVTSGTWSISNIRYTKATQTQFTLAPKDASFDRWDLIYAGTNNDVLIITGTPTLVPDKPVLPANTIEVDYAYIPAVGDPYLLSGGSADSNGGSFVTFTNSNTVGITSVLATGIITVNMGVFVNIATNGIIRGNFDLRYGTDWIIADVTPEITKDINGKILTATFNVNNVNIDEIRGRIY